MEYSVYKPVLVLFGLVDGLQHLLKVCDHTAYTYMWWCDVVVWCVQRTVDVQGADLPHALLDYIRNNDVALLEGCDKVRWSAIALYVLTLCYSSLALVQVPRRVITCRVLWRDVWCFGYVDCSTPLQVVLYNISCSSFLRSSRGYSTASHFPCWTFNLCVSEIVSKIVWSQETSHVPSTCIIDV